MYRGGNRNSGYYNSGNSNSGDYNNGHYNSGNYNSGNYNSGNYNSGHYNSGICNSGHHNSGNGNSGNYNNGRYNSGDFNSGMFNSCNYSSGVFCTTTDTIRCFNIQTNMTAQEFLESKYYEAIISVPFNYSDEQNCQELIYSYKESCKNWWSAMSDKNKAIILDLPNFDKDIFFEITGIVLNNS